MQESKDQLKKYKKELRCRVTGSQEKLQERDREIYEVVANRRQLKELESDCTDAAEAMKESW
jgi:hypothetical protein